MTDPLRQPLRLPCGAVLANRLCKAALTEGLADGWNRATERHVRLYRKWAEGGAGLVLTGNVQVDRRYLERPGNVAIDGNGGLAELKAYARAGTAGGNHLWMQIGHAGRQTPRRVNPQPVAPSATAMSLPASAYAPPRMLRPEEIPDIIRRFAHVAAMARETGFTGIQIHAAHGYLLSEFLSPRANQRDDEWGGPLENRARALLQVVRACRRSVGNDFPVGVRLNSSDFQQGGFTHAECLEVVRWLGAAGIDLLEISGGNYEQPSMMGLQGRELVHDAPVADSTRAREAYFLDYAESIRRVAAMPLMVTGGFRTRAGMQAALASGALDVIGLGRPMCLDTDLPNRLFDHAVDQAARYEAAIDPPKAGLGWFCLQLIRIADGLEPDRAMTGANAMADYVRNEEETAARLVRAG